MPYYVENFTGAAGTTARAEQVESEFQAVATGFAAAEADIGRSIRSSVDALTALPDNAANRALKWLRFNASGQPQLIAAPFTWRGNWAPSTLYLVGDVVRAGPNNSIYICHTEHTSGGTFSITNWNTMIDLTSLNVITNEIRTSSFTAAVGGDYMINSSGGDVTVTLPASPVITDPPINITHIAGSLAPGQRIIIARNGRNIMGLPEDMTIDVSNASISLMWSNDTFGWRLRVLV